MASEFKTNCPACGKGYTVRPELEGKAGKCSECGEVFRFARKKPLPRNKRLEPDIEPPPVIDTSKKTGDAAATKAIYPPPQTEGILNDLSPSTDGVFKEYWTPAMIQIIWFGNVLLLIGMLLGGLLISIIATDGFRAVGVWLLFLGVAGVFSLPLIRVVLEAAAVLFDLLRVAKDIRSELRKLNKQD